MSAGDPVSAGDGLIDYLAASPTPFHAAQESARQLAESGFAELSERDAWPAEPGRYVIVRDGSLIAWSTEHSAGPTTPMRIVGAHTDSPNLRIKPQPDYRSAGWSMLGVEPYGGGTWGTWLDRDLGLAGRVAIRDAAAPDGVATRLFAVDQAVLRVSNLAIHLDRSMNDGVQLNPQLHLAPHWAVGDTQRDFAAYLADRVGASVDELLGWDAMTVDQQRASYLGTEHELIAGARMDNLATSFAGTRALIAAAGAAPAAPTTQVLALFDHEEIGSMTARGAFSSLLTTVLERITGSLGGGRDELHRALAGSVVASGDMAHATHPNYADRHEPRHLIAMNGGPVLKLNVNGRYATDARGQGVFELACDQAGVPVQRFVVRSDLPCGSTVGPMTAALTGVTTVDFGAPTLSMHSVRELVGTQDQQFYADALTAFLSPA